MKNEVHQHTTQLTESGVVPPIEAPSAQHEPVPALTIIYHPILRRVGDRVVLGELVAGREAKIARHTPRFAPPHQLRGAPLSHPRISRTPFLLRRHASGGVVLDPSASRTRIRIAGERVGESRVVTPAELEAGVILELSDRVALLLHLCAPQDESEVGDLGLVGQSSAILRVREDIRRVASLPMPVLVRGETGTGKELVAGALHEASVRHARPMVSVNLAALPGALAAAELFGATRGAFTGAARTQEVYFRRAHGGTLFLDEIGETPVDVQVMLLRVLETGEIYSLGAQRAEQVNVRIISATDADLDELVAQGSFRAPLLHRLAGYEIHLPPLRVRRDDISRLLMYFLGLELAEIGDTERLDRSGPLPWLPMALMTQLVRYDWPGNVRQLRNVARQLVIGNRDRIEATLGLRSAVRYPTEITDLHQLPPAELDERGAVGSDAGAEVASAAPGDANNGDGGGDVGDVGDIGDDEVGGAGLEGSLRVRARTDLGDVAGLRRRRKPSEIPERELIAVMQAHRWDIKATARALGISRTSLYGLIESSAEMRTAGELEPAEIEHSFHRASGDLDMMVEQLRVSKSALRRRIKELGLA